MSDENTPETPAPPRKPEPPKPELFLPPQGSLEEQVARQMDFLTQGVMECMVRSSGLFDPRPPEAVAPPRDAYGNYDWGKQPIAPPPAPDRRSTELRDAAHLSNAAARLIAAHAKLRGEFHFTYSRIEQAVPGTPVPSGSRRARKEDCGL